MINWKGISTKGPWPILNTTTASAWNYWEKPRETEDNLYPRPKHEDMERNCWLLVNYFHVILLQIWNYAILITVINNAKFCLQSLDFWMITAFPDWTNWMSPFIPMRKCKCPFSEVFCPESQKMAEIQIPTQYKQI